VRQDNGSADRLAQRAFLLLLCRLFRHGHSQAVDTGMLNDSNIGTIPPPFVPDGADAASTQSSASPGIRSHEPYHLLLQLGIYFIGYGHNVGKQRVESQSLHVFVQHGKNADLQ
jgi:hypothetical protein